MKIIIADTIGENCITLADGQKIYRIFHDDLKKNIPVELDFTGVGIIASPFLNFAIGQLFRDIPEKTITNSLAMTGLTEHGRLLVERIVSNAQKYYQNARYQKAVDHVIESGGSRY